MGLGYCDFNLKARSKAEARPLCLAALEAGFRVVAINTEVEASVFAKRTKKDPPKALPQPLEISLLQKEFEGKLQILQRLTVQIEDSLQAHKLIQSSHAMEYDILAVQPLNPQAFQHACSTMEVDLIAFDWTDCAPLKAARKVVRQAKERGIIFEAQYCPLVLSSATRRNAIALTHALHAVGRGRAPFLLTSGAAAPHHLRSPTDASNLALLLGMSEEAAKNCMKQAARTVLLNAQARRMGRGMVFAQSTRTVEEKIDAENGVPTPAKRRKANEVATVVLE